MQSFPGGKRLDAQRGYVGGKRQDQVHSAGRLRYRYDALEMVVQRGDEQALATAVNPSRLPDLRGVVTLRDEVG